MVALIIKLMPSSNTTNLEEIEHSARKILEKEGAKNLTFEKQEIAFGLKALMIKMAMPEEKGTEDIEHKLGTIKEVSSVTIEDYRRAFG